MFLSLDTSSTVRTSKKGRPSVKGWGQSDTLSGLHRPPLIHYRSTHRLPLSFQTNILASRTTKLTISDSTKSCLLARLGAAITVNRPFKSSSSPRNTPPTSGTHVFAVRQSTPSRYVSAVMRTSVVKFFSCASVSSYFRLA